MSIDFWGLALQAINVLILMWLLLHFFWRPIAGLIEKRQNTVRTLLDEATATKERADEALTELNDMRAGIASEREEALRAAAAEAETARNLKLSEAKEIADTELASARRAIARNTDDTRDAREAEAADLAVALAEKLLDRMATSTVADAFLASLLDALALMPEKQRTALVSEGGAIDLVTPTSLNPAERTKLSQAVALALGGSPQFNFVADRALIAGLELRTAHFVLHNSWGSDLLALSKRLKHVV